MINDPPFRSIFTPLARVWSFPTRSLTTSAPWFLVISMTCLTGSRRASITRWAPIFSASLSLLSTTSAAVIETFVIQRSHVRRFELVQPHEGPIGGADELREAAVGSNSWEDQVLAMHVFADPARSA